MDLIAAAAREFARIISLVDSGPLDSPVPTCPEWTVADLGVHVGNAAGFWAHVLCDGSGRPKPPIAPPPSGSGLGPWLSLVRAGLLTELQETPPDSPAWNPFGAPQDAAFVRRRMAHELAIHRYDAESARDDRHPIDQELAVDGIDEMLGSLAPSRTSTRASSGQTMHLHGTDPGGAAEWFVTLNPGAIEVRKEHAKGDLALRGPVSDLELMLYGRPPLGAVEEFGDASVLAAFQSDYSF